MYISHLSVKLCYCLPLYVTGLSSSGLFFWFIGLYINLNYVMCLIKLDQVKVNTVLGSSAPPLTVKLVRAFISGSKDSSVIKSLVSNDFFFLFDFFLG
jgi:hypothetical protein